MAVLCLLGVPKLDREGELSVLPVDKPASLLYYLARRGDWVSRSELAFLYRPDASESVALSNVRLNLHRAKENAWAAALQVEKFRVRFAAETDVNALEKAFVANAWGDVLQITRGQFLDGMALQGVPSYETWLELERQAFSQKWRLAALHHIHDLEAQADWTEAEYWLERVLKLDPLDEEALQTYLRVLFAAGKRSVATDAFVSFREHLKQELDVEPLAATSALYEGLRGAESDPFTLAPKAKSRHNLPVQTTRFVGRKRELERLSEILSRSDCPLLTLIGLGGIGKTRLALELASTQLEQYKDGVYFVPLAGVKSVELVAVSIANSIGLKLAGKDAVEDQLASFLANKALLLVLDNVEHLLGAAMFLEGLLELAPELCLLVTSRIALELPAEWLFDVTGLDYPLADSSEDLNSFDAVRLFNDRAERLSATFVPAGETLNAVAALCRKVEGMPLALELAASWARSLTVPQLLAELNHSLDLLSSQLRHTLPRHSSIEKVFHYSWKKLGLKEQIALARLSVFQGDFSLDAAQQVTSTHLALLLRLLNHSLLRRTQGGKFDLHPLIRHYAAERLSDIADAELILERYVSFYLHKLVDGKAVHDLWQPGGVKRMTAEYDDICAAWFLAMEQQEHALLAQAARNFYHYFTLSGRFREGQKHFAVTLEKLEEQPLGVSLQGYLSVFYFYLGDYATCQALLDASLTQTARPEEKAFIYLLQANLCYVQGNWQEGLSFASQAKTIYQTLHDDLYQIRCLMTMSSNAWSAGDYKATGDYHQQAWQLLQKLDIPFFRAFLLRERGVLASSTNQFVRAQRYLVESIDLFELLDSPYNAAVAKNNLGFVLGKLGDYKQQLTIYKQVLASHEVTENLQGIAFARFHIAEAYLALGQRNDAEQYYKQGLKLALDLQHKAYMAKILTGFAALLANTDREQALALLCFATEHPHLKISHREQAIEQLQKLEPSDKELGRARTHAATLDLETVARDLLA